MSNTTENVSHDHDYCVSKVEEEKAIDFVVENVLNSSPKTSPDAEVNERDSMVLSPAYSCDSGIDSFANDLTQGFGDESDELLKFLLDDDFEFDSQISQKNLEGNLKSTAMKLPKVPQTTAVKAQVPTKIAKSNDSSVDERNRKNADNARENRKKKKLYIAGLEKEVEDLRNQKLILTKKSSKLEKRANELENEVNYLRSILANQSMLSKLIESVSMVPGVSLSTSFRSSRDPSLRDNEPLLGDNKSLLKDNDVECIKENMVSTRLSKKRTCDSESVLVTKKCRGSTNVSAGVCLHVNQSKVSLEFCQHCSRMAKD